MISLVITGCEVSSFFDPAVVGRWERTPVVLPILDQLDVIDEESSDPPGLTQVQPEDLIETVQEYVMGPGDLITVTIYELISPGVESFQNRRIDDLGMIRLPVVGPIKVEGYTPSSLEVKIAQILENKGVLKNPTVSVIVQDQRQRVFSVIGESSNTSTAIGTYTIISKDFRLLDAMALARGVPGSIKKLYVIRQIPMPADVHATPGVQTEEDGYEETQGDGNALQSSPPSNPADLLQGLIKGVEPEAPPQPAQTQPVVQPPPAALQSSMDEFAQPSPWVHTGGKWTQADHPRSTASSPPATASSPDAVSQRIIEIPYDKLLEGDTRYNIIIRPHDIIRVPPPVIGNIYIGGAINRPGTYALPGDKDLTLKQLVFAAGNLSGIAIPERVDLTRRLGRNQEAIVRLNLRAITNGTQPDFFLKPNDTINIGTNFLATPLAVIRNGFRTSYGFGFILDRNFSENVFGPTQN